MVSTAKMTTINWPAGTPQWLSFPAECLLINSSYFILGKTVNDTSTHENPVYV
jgi:hypothetical protein